MWVDRVKRKVSRYLSTLAGVDHRLSLQLDLTNSCNLKCSHCYHPHHSNKGAIGTSEWLEIIGQYSELLDLLNLRPKIILCGGEPLLSRNLRPVATQLFSIWPEVEVTVLTNGTVTPKRALEVFENRHVEFQVSLDAPDPDSHDLIRGKGNFQKSIEGIKTLKEEGFGVSILSVLSTGSAHRIKDFFLLAKHLGTSQNFTRSIAHPHSTSGHRPLLPLELKKAYFDIVKYSHVYNVRTNTNEALFRLIHKDLGAHGGMGFQGLTIDYKGNLKISSRVDLVVGNVLKESLQDLFLNNEIFNSLRSGNIEVCGECRYFSRCGGNRNAAYMQNGNILAHDPGCWLGID